MTCECVIFQRAEMKAHLIRFQLRHGVDISVSLCVCVCCIQLGTVIFYGRKKKGREMSRERKREHRRAQKAIPTTSTTERVVQLLDATSARLQDLCPIVRAEGKTPSDY